MSQCTTFAQPLRDRDCMRVRIRNSLILFFLSRLRMAALGGNELGNEENAFKGARQIFLCLSVRISAARQSQLPFKGPNCRQVKSAFPTLVTGTSRSDRNHGAPRSAAASPEKRY